MPFVVGDYEKMLLDRGHMVCTLVGAHWHCNACPTGQMILTREIDGSGRAKPAMFICDKCGRDMNIYPAQSGGVQPALGGFGIFKMKKETVYGKDIPPKDDGRWR